MNECLDDNGGCEQICNNSEGSYSCNCNDGYSADLDGTGCSREC